MKLEFVLEGRKTVVFQTGTIQCILTFRIESSCFDDESCSSTLVCLAYACSLEQSFRCL